MRTAARTGTFRRLSTVTACAVGGVVALGALGAAPAFAECQNPVGAAGTFVCTDTTTTQPVPVVGGQEVVVGGYSVGGFPVSTPPVSPPQVGPTSTPAVPVTSPTRVCFFVDCIESGETLATVPSQPLALGPVSVLPAQTVPVPAVTVPVLGRQTLPGSVPVPGISYESDRLPSPEQLDATVNEAFATVDLVVQQVNYVLDDPLCYTAYTVDSATDASLPRQVPPAVRPYVYAALDAVPPLAPEFCYY